MKNSVTLFSDEGKLVPLKNQDKINVSTLVGKIIDFVSDNTETNPDLVGNRRDNNFVMSEGIHFLTSFSTSQDEILERQKLFQALCENKELVEFLVTTDAPYFQRASNREDIELGNLYAGTVSYANYFEKILSLTKDTDLDFMHEQLYSFMKERKIEQLKNLNYTQKEVRITIPVTLIIKKREDYDDRFSFKSDGTIVGQIKVDDRVEPVMGSLFGYFRTELSKGKKLSLDSLDIEEYFLSNRLWEKVLHAYFQHLLTCKDFGDEMMVKFEVLYEEYEGSAKVSFFDDTDNFHFVIRGDVKKFQKNIKKPKSFNLDYFTFNIPTIQLSCAGLYASSSFLSGRRDAMLKVLHNLDHLIFLAHLAYWYNNLPKGIKTCYPVILPKEDKICEIKGGVNPVLFDRKKVVPNDISFSALQTGYVITGANTGGKTAMGNMVAYNQLFAQLGLPVFARRAKISLVDDILLHYTENTDINANQSRYASELKRLDEEVIHKVTEYSLVIFDEPFSGTSEVSAKSQAVNVLRVMSELRCRMVMTTHLHKLIPFVDKLPSFVNTHFVLPTKKKGDFIMKPGGLSKSSGELLAKEYKVTYGQMKKTINKNKNKKVA